KLESVDIRMLKTGEKYRFAAEGVFIFIGYVPNTSFLTGAVKMNEYGEITVNNDMSTSIKGVFAAGDSIAKKYRQISTAVGEGTVAALAATEFTYQVKNKMKHELIS
ncbi:MAG TPA: FAD-dependent oxidoreductase, partial [Bacteroidales bacterium]|nr:FAD-dependent oxidoreductase [Bacteroidales bacterium]